MALYPWFKNIPLVEELLVEYFPPEFEKQTYIDFYLRIGNMEFLYKVLGKRTAKKTFEKFEQLRKRYILNYIFIDQEIQSFNGQFYLNSSQNECYKLTNQANKSAKYVFGESQYKGFLIVCDLSLPGFKIVKTTNETDLARGQQIKRMFFLPFDKATISKKNGEVISIQEA